jgi:hypothetical protein
MTFGCEGAFLQIQLHSIKEEKQINVKHSFIKILLRHLVE